MGVKPPLCRFVRVFGFELNVSFVQPLLTRKFRLEERMIKRRAHHGQAAQQLAQDVALFRVARPVAAGDDRADCILQDCLRRGGRCAVPSRATNMEISNFQFN